MTTIPGGKPTIADPGLTPTSPEMTEGPVLVTVEPASTAKDVAVPNPTGAWADCADAGDIPATPTMSTMTAAVPTARTAPSEARSLFG
ncbi:hypothetical protein GCM10009610_38560 [Pseudonocardia xinjiangensis]